MCKSKTTQTTTIPPKTEDELRLDSMMIDVILPSYLEGIGYDMTSKEVTKYKNPAKVTSLEGSRDDIMAQLADLESKPGNNSAEISKLQARLDAVNTDLDKEYANSTTDYEYDYELNETGQKMQEINKQSMDYQQEAMGQFMEVYRKFSSGDYSITDEQKDLISEQLGAIRDPVLKLLDEAEKTAEETGASINKSLDEYITQINETGLSAGAALNAIEDRINLNKENLLKGISNEEDTLMKSGASVKAALAGVMDEINKTGESTRQVYEDLFETKSILVAQKMEDLYKTNMRQNAERASMLGRSPMDPQFQDELMSNMYKSIKEAQLELSVQESEALAGLEERTGQRREQLKLQEAGFEEAQGQRAGELAAKKTAAEEAAGNSLTAVGSQKADLALRQGQALEGVASTRASVAERTGAAKEGIAGQRAALEEDLQKTGANLAQSYGVGIPASQIGLGIDVAGFNQAVLAQNTALQGSALNATAGVADRMQRERMAQPTTTTTQQASPFDMVTGLIGAGLSGAGAIMGGVGAMR